MEKILLVLMLAMKAILFMITTEPMPESIDSLGVDTKDKSFEVRLRDVEKQSAINTTENKLQDLRLDYNDKRMTTIEYQNYLIIGLLAVIALKKNRKEIQEIVSEMLRNKIGAKGE
jgi:hypothetical protein